MKNRRLIEERNAASCSGWLYIDTVFIVSWQVVAAGSNLELTIAPITIPTISIDQTIPTSLERLS